VENNHHIDRIFRSGVHQYELRPSDDVWNRIESELSNSSSSAHAGWHFARYAAMVMVFFAIALITSPIGRQRAITNTAYFPVNNSLEQILPVITNAELTRPSADLSSLQAKLESDNTVKSIVTFAAMDADEVQLKSPIKPAAQETIKLIAQLDVSDRSLNTTQPVDMLGAGFIDNTSGKGHFELMQTPAHKAKYRDLDMRGMYFGLSGAYNQTSILESGNAFKGTRPIQPSLKFGTAKGIKMGYNISNTFGIEAEYVYNAVQGQNYVLSEEDEIVERSLSLSYDLIPIVAKLKVGKISDITNQPIVLNYTAGVQYGILRDARMPQDKRYEESAEELFNHNDVSLVLGLEYDVYVSDNLVLSAGARGTFSNDISTHIEPLNDYAKRNFVFGLRGSVSYVFR